ncbi:hypothetical protein FX155_05955 [Acidaminococcus fermentans]|uniref:Schlafen group 3-like DNA/RNA helicase domain-containing protein n=1 Tax=Acidaminococcus fermentans TaxID=905 RepID=A0A6N7W1R2_ACIFE|nr:hypothetical protein [Acidaminococcus fermentans]
MGGRFQGHQSRTEKFQKAIESVYRVLFTRSRKGMFLYFPRESKDWKLEETYRWFVGMMEIEEKDL